MSSLRPPSHLSEMLAGTALESPVLGLLQATTVVVSDNSTPFFPAYTDHGADHVQAVLDGAVALIPRKVIELETFAPLDAAVLICSVAIHDLAMHVTEAGFVELVASDRFQARPGLSSAPGRSPDPPWYDLWKTFQHEAQHFRPTQLETLFGGGYGTVPDIAFETGLDPSRWRDTDRLLVGEFLRRHHGRLAHEITFSGFPAVPATHFPILAASNTDLAEGAGIVARSHTEPLRDIAAYLDYLAPGNRRPLGALLHYHMALLRIADFLQVESDRAPAILLHVKSPRSPTSISEWQRHGAVSSISWNHRDPQALYANVTPSHSLRTHLALADLFAAMQKELDASSAILSEVFDSPALSHVRLGRTRILSNLDEPSLHAQLPYFATRAALKSDPDLFRLVVRNLYGDHPSVAGRELIQNAADAVRSREAWEQRSGVEVPEVDWRDLRADVVVTLANVRDYKWELRVADRGIGMTPELVQRYFLQAGASFRPTPDDMITELAGPVMKAGRFGIGVFAAFLLGDEIRVTTRHVSSDTALSFTAVLSDDLVELRKCEAPVGTEVVVPFTYDDDAETRKPIAQLFLELQGFYRLTRPTFAFICEGVQVQHEIGHGDIPQPDEVGGFPWRSVPETGLDGVLWRTDLEVGLVHNGMLVGPPGVALRSAGYHWAEPSAKQLITPPHLAIFDPAHRVGLTLQRYELSGQFLPFEAALLGSIGKDLIAHALVCGPMGHPLTYTRRTSLCTPTQWLPWIPEVASAHIHQDLVALVTPGPEWGSDRLVRAFHGGDAIAQWPETQYRMVCQASAFSGTPKRSESRGERLRRIVAEETQVLTKWLGGCHLATVFIGPHTVCNELRRSDEVISRTKEDLRAARVGLARNNSAAEELLNNVATDFPTQESGYALVMLACNGASHPCGTIASTWNSAVAGPLPREPSELIALADTVSDSELAAMIQDWVELRSDPQREATYRDACDERSDGPD